MTSRTGRSRARPARDGVALGLAAALVLCGSSAAAQDDATEPLFLEGSWSRWLLQRPSTSSLEWAFGRDAAVRLRVGGTIREQFEAYDDFELGVEPETRGYDDYHLHRLLLHADLSVGERVRLFTQFGNSNIAGNDRPAGPVDDDEAYVHQAFVEVALDGALLDAGDGLDLRLGRQELSFGSGRLVSLRDGPNLRRSFDAGRLSLRSQRGVLDVFVGTEVRSRPGNFDNEPTDEVVFWGAYATLFDVIDDQNLDLYYFGLDRERSVFDVGTDAERRHSLGARLWGDAGRWDVNVEPVVQFGSFGDRDIAAWTLGTDTGVRLGEAETSPHIGLRANVISGGSSNGTLRTFNALFPNNSYFSEAALFAPANLIDVNPTLSVTPREGVVVTAMWDHLWRFDVDDGIYVPPGVPVLGGNTSDERYIGHSLSLLAEWELTERVKAFAAYTRFEAGPAVDEAGGGDVDYLLFGVDLSF